MSEAVVVALCSFAATLLTGLGGYQLIAYRVEQLEKKIQTHARCIEYEKKNGTITEEFQQRKAVEVLKKAVEIVKGGGVDA